jgi:hypothetical protein
MVHFSSRPTVAGHDAALDSAGAITLSAAHYLDRNLQEREIDRVLRYAWHPVARTQRLANNSTMECRLLNETIAIKRDSGAIRGWALTGAEQARSQQNRREFGRRLAVEVWNGFVMVNQDHDASPLAPQLAPLTRYLEPYALHDRIQVDVHEVTASWDWKLSVEHFNLSMEGYRNGSSSQALADAVEVDSDGAWSLVYGRAQSRDGGQGIFPICDDLPIEYRTRINAVNIFPTLHLVTDPMIALWIHVNVLEPQRHLLRWSLLLPRRSLAVARAGGRLDHYCEILRVLLNDHLQALAHVSNPQNIPDALQERSKLKSVQRLHRWLAQQDAGRVVG